MAEVGATDSEVGQLIDRDAEQIEAWRKGDAEIDPEARILLRTFLADDPHAAQLAIDRLRNRVVRNLEGEGAQHARVSVPYGTSDIGKLDAGSPQ